MVFFAVQANPYTDRSSLVEKHSGFKIGDIVQVKEWHGKYKINYIIAGALIQVHLYKLGRNGKPSKYNSSTLIKNLMPLDAAQPNTNKNGLTAKEYAEQIFKSGFAVHDYARTTRQSLVKVISISKTGRVKVQLVHVIKGTSAKIETFTGKPRPSQEIDIIDWSKLQTKSYDDPETYTPHLHNSEWKFWHGEEYIQQPGMKLELLLD